MAEAEELLQQWEAVAHMRLALNDDLFQAAGGAAKLEEELGEELGVRGRVQVWPLVLTQASLCVPHLPQAAYNCQSANDPEEPALRS